MNRIIADVKCDLNSVPNLEEILTQELEIANQLKEKDILEHVFTKTDATRAILVFKGIDEEKAKLHVANFPLAPYFGAVAYINVEKYF